MAIDVQVEADAMGMDPRRLAAMDEFFQRHVDEGRLPGWHIVVSRGGKVVHSSTAGSVDLETGAAVERDTRWRIFSMTKPITSVALMLLWERGLFQLDDPIERYLPEFANPRVYVAGSAEQPVTEPAKNPITFRHLLTHTAGLTYGFFRTHPVDAMYRDKGFVWGAPAGMSLAQACEQWASVPLLFEPGTSWTYSVAIDVCGRLVEVLSGKSFDTFLNEELFVPLDMNATSFYTEEKLPRVYTKDPVSQELRPAPQLEETGTRSDAMLSGGGGLVSTASDYWKFCEMLASGGQLAGNRILGNRTVQMLMSNHLPGNADLQTYGQAVFSEAPMHGVGFGLGGAVALDPIAVGNLCSVGEFSWGGAASTAFWVDPLERITVQFFTQLFPSNALPIRSQLRMFVNSALRD